MTTFVLKIIACLSMLIDHIGFIFFPEYLVFRIIGRIAFPIFAFLIVEGYCHTHNLKKYFKRLIILAIISQIPSSLAFNLSDINYDPQLLLNINLYIKHYNIIITLILGLLAIYLYDRNKKAGISFLIIICALIYIMCIPVEYSWYGILVIFFFYLFRGNIKKQSIAFIILTLLDRLEIFYVFAIRYKIPFSIVYFEIFFQVFSILALIFIARYNNKKGKNAKYLFYVFYPAYLLILFLIKYYI